MARSNFTGDLRDMLEALEAIQPLLDKAEIWQFRDIYIGGAMAAAFIQRGLQDHRHGRRAAGREITGCCNGIALQLAVYLFFPYLFRLSKYYYPLHTCCLHRREIG